MAITKFTIILTAAILMTSGQVLARGNGSIGSADATNSEKNISMNLAEVGEVKSFIKNASKLKTTKRSQEIAQILLCVSYAKSPPPRVFSLEMGLCESVKLSKEIFSSLVLATKAESFDTLVEKLQKHLERAQRDVDAYRSN